jgi:hypothetical protein
MEDYYEMDENNNLQQNIQHYVPTQQERAAFNLDHADFTNYQENVYGFYSNVDNGLSFNNLKCLPLTYFHSYHLDKYANLENSNRIILPQYILSELSKYSNIIYPLTFQIEGLDDLLGVADFISDTRIVFLPQRIFDKVISLQYHDHDNNLNKDLNTTQDLMDNHCELVLKLYNLKIPRGRMVKFQVEDAKFLEIEDCKSYLEQHLQQQFSILQKNISIEIPAHPIMNYPFNKTLQINIIECQPEDAILITETDLAIEFEEPVNYKKYLKDLREIESTATTDTIVSNNDYWHQRDLNYFKIHGFLPVPYEKGNKSLRVRLNFNFLKFNLDQ